MDNCQLFSASSCTVVGKETFTTRDENGKVAMSSYLDTQLQLLVSLETQHRSCKDQQTLLSIPFSTPCSTWRERVATWLYDVVDYLEVPRDVVFVAMNILDRYVAIGRENCISDKKQYELASITSMFLAVRLAGSVTLSVPSLLQLSSTDLQAKDVMAMAGRMLGTLSWDHRVVTPSAFVKSMLGLFNSSLSQEAMFSLYEQASYLVEIAVCDQFFVTVPPSEIALAAITVAVNGQHELRLHQKTSSFFVQRVLQESGMNLDSASMKMTCNRLQCIYQQSDDFASVDMPHVIVDDEEGNDAVSTSYEHNLDIDLVVPDVSAFDLRPACLHAVNAPK